MCPQSWCRFTLSGSPGSATWGLCWLPVAGGVLRPRQGRSREAETGEARVMGGGGAGDGMGASGSVRGWVMTRMEQGKKEHPCHRNPWTKEWGD